MTTVTKSPEPLTVTVATASSMLGLGASGSTYRKLARDGVLPAPVKLGKRTVVIVEELRAAANKLPLA